MFSRPSCYFLVASVWKASSVMISTLKMKKQTRFHELTPVDHNAKPTFQRRVPTFQLREPTASSQREKLLMVQLHFTLPKCCQGTVMNVDVFTNNLWQQMRDGPINLAREDGVAVRWIWIQEDKREILFQFAKPFAPGMDRAIYKGQYTSKTPTCNSFYYFKKCDDFLSLR